MTLVYIYVLGFAGSMMICAYAFWPYRSHREFRENLATWTIGAMVASACWPLVLLAALVANSDQ